MKRPNNYVSLLSELTLMKKFALSLFCLLAILSCIQSQTVDSTFGSNGFLPYGPTGNYVQNSGRGNRTAIQPDGKIVVAMDLSDPNNNTDLWYYTFRYNADGTPDSTFGTNGVSEIFAGTQSKNRDVQVQSDGKIVVIGETEYCTNSVCGAPQFIMMRLKTNGDLDSTFGTNGQILTTDVFGSNGLFASPERVVQAQNNKYIIGGRGIAGKPFVGRMNNNGTMDASFGTNGVFSDTAYAVLIDLIIDMSGNSYALLIKYNQNDTINPSDSYVIKLNSNGVLDNTFGVGGRVIFNTANVEHPASIAIRSDNKLVITGDSQPVYLTGFNDGYGETNMGYILILNPDGSASTILPQGYRTLLVPGDTTTFICRVIITAGDNMLISGKTITKIAGNFHEKAFIAYLDANGSLNPGFHSTGIMKFDYGMHSTIGSLACFTDLDLLSNGDIIATGYRNPIAFNTLTSLFVLKLYNTNISSPTSIYSLEKNLSPYNIYPNPGEGIFHISVNNPSSIQNCRFEIYNTAGECVLQKEISTEINLSNQPKGIYLLKIYNSGELYYHKIIVQ